MQRNPEIGRNGRSSGSRPIRRGSMFELPCFEPCLNSFLSSFVFPSVPCPLAVAMKFHVGNNWTHSLLLRKLKCFKHVLWRLPVWWYVFENHAEWRFCLAPFWCVAPGQHSGARLAQWRPSALLLPSFVLALCLARAHFCGCSS